MATLQDRALKLDPTVLEKFLSLGLTAPARTTDVPALVTKVTALKEEYNVKPRPEKKTKAAKAEASAAATSEAAAAAAAAAAAVVVAANATAEAAAEPATAEPAAGDDA
jgi:hypothetical protein